MGRKKQMVRQMIENRRAETRELDKLSREKEKKDDISEEEHNKRLEMLKNLGLNLGEEKN